MTPDNLTIGLAQIAPVWLNRSETTEKMCSFIQQAAERNCNIVAFGEALLPGYPFWVSYTDGARFNDSVQKEIYGHYQREAVQIERGDLDTICDQAKQNKIATYLGIIERPKDRGGNSLYCSMVFIDQTGQIKSVHRKLMPTYDERLVWSIGDGNGLVVHKIGDFTVGGLNCWENWMPMARTALHAQGENLHFAIWPGGVHNTQDITRFIALESRSFVVSVSGLMRKENIADALPHTDLIRKKCPQAMATGGSCVAGPDGQWLLEPQADKEDLFVTNVDLDKIRQERHNFDPSGHYARPDVLQLQVNRWRQKTVKFNDDTA